MLAAAVLLAGFTLAAPPTCDATHALRVLFIGNSFTYVQNVPKLVEAIAAGLPGPCIETGMIAIGGATLEDQWRGDSAAQRVRDGHWTQVVLNDQSALGEGWFLEGKGRVGTSGRELADYGARFADVIRRAGAAPVLLAHWADADAPARDQQALDYQFAQVGRATRALIIPAGRAIKRMQAELPSVNPYFTDNHHLSAAGAYLEALTVYAALTGGSPVGAPGRIVGPPVELMRGIVFMDSTATLVDLPPAVASRLQQIAAAIDAETRGHAYDVTAPAPLSAEFPQVPPSGDAIAPGSLAGSWRGLSRVLPNPNDDSVAIEFHFGGAGSEPSGDSLRLSAGPLAFAGPATIEIQGTRIIIRASVLAQDRRGRGRSPPLAVELQAVMLGGEMTGVATIRQRFENSAGTFDAIGRFRARKTG